MPEKDHARFAPAERPRQIIQHLIDQVSRVIIGKRDVIEKLVVALVAGGHVLLEDVPGVGKTQLVKTLARVTDCRFRRIQCTPDLLPADLTGVAIFDRQRQEFVYKPGPLHANLVLADELNRTSPRTQSAMLEAMEERSVTVDGETYPLPEPFMVLATQNPLDFEGTYVLPEAQLDRFMMKLSLGYPQKEEELMMLAQMAGGITAGGDERDHAAETDALLRRDVLLDWKRRATRVRVEDAIRQYIVELAHRTRRHPDLAAGASPRASGSLLRAAQALAFARGREYVIPDDVKSLAADVFGHRVVLSHEAKMSGTNGRELVQDIVDRLPAPVLTQSVVG